MILLALAGCSPVGLVSPDLTPSGGVEVAEIKPAWGPPDGGTEVTITGEGFVGAVEVDFGDADLTVDVLDEETLLVTSPYVGFPVDVDVTVRSDYGETVVPGGFSYSATRPPDIDTTDSNTTGSGTTDTGTTDTGTTVGPTGLSGGLIEFSLLQTACPDCFGLTSDLDVYAAARLYDPVPGSWTGWLPSVGTCVENPRQNVPTTVGYDVGEWVYLTSGANSVGLRREVDGADTTYMSGVLDNNDYQRNAGYTFSIGDNAEVGALEVRDAVITPDGFDSISPEEILYTTTRDAFSGRISQSGTTFTWAPSGGAGTFVILLAIYAENGASLLGQVLCQGNDNGSMGIPAGYLLGYPVGSLVAVYMQRYSIETTVLPVNGATLESVAKVGVLGTGTVVP